MKKTPVLLLLLILGTSSLFAGFGYRLDLLSFDPLYTEYQADKYRTGMSFDYAYVADGFPDYVYQDWRQANQVGDKKNDAMVFELNRKLTQEPFVGILNIGETLSLLRHTFSFDAWLSPISIDFSTQGMISFIMDGQVADNIGFDGAYFFGTTIRAADRFSLRAGFHHYCSHYGDAILKRIDNHAVPGGLSDLDKFWITYKYVRMNGIAIGISVDPVTWLRVYGEYNFLPKNIKSWRPVIFRPNWTDLTPHNNYPDEYGARIINFGFELEYPIFRKWGNTIFAYDCHLYEEGKIMYRDVHGKPDTSMTPVYDPGAPWEMEHSFLLAQEINDSVSFECGYRHGRFPSNSFYYQRSSYFFLGARFNPNPTVNLINTEK
ncbi:MAG: hypothetical protein EOM62_17150 [Bacteroidia bacterium]|nr:hypothetical protein [Bacteroidia bacterium]